MELGATPLTPPVEVGGTEYPVLASEQKPPCPVVDDPEPRTQITLTVLEHELSPDELPLYERLEALMDTLLPGDILYLIILPRSMAGDAITSWPLTHFARIGPLNVDTNPQLRNNDPRTREGFKCVK